MARWSAVTLLSSLAFTSVDTGATFDDLREVVATLEEIEPIARRVLGGAHPLTKGIEIALRRTRAQAALRARTE